MRSDAKSAEPATPTTTRIRDSSHGDDVPSGRQYRHLRLVHPISTSQEHTDRPGRNLLNAYCFVVGCIATGLGVRLATTFGIDWAPARFALVGATVVIVSTAGGLLADTILQLPQRFTRLREDRHRLGRIGPQPYGRRGDEYSWMLAEERLIVAAAEVISEALEEHAVSRREFAERLGLPPSHVSTLLSGERDLTIRDLADMLHVLGYQLDLSLIAESTPPGPLDADDV